MFWSLIYYLFCCPLRVSYHIVASKKMVTWDKPARANAPCYGRPSHRLNAFHSHLAKISSSSDRKKDLWITTIKMNQSGTTSKKGVEYPHIYRTTKVVMSPTWTHSFRQRRNKTTVIIKQKSIIWFLVSSRVSVGTHDGVFAQASACSAWISIWSFSTVAHLR